MWIIFPLKAAMITLSSIYLVSSLSAPWRLISWAVTMLCFRCVGANWWSLTPGRAMLACMFVWAQIWSERGTVIPQSWWCTVSFHAVIVCAAALSPLRNISLTRSLFLQNALCWCGGRWTRWSWRRRLSTSCVRSMEIPSPLSDGAERKGSFPAGGETGSSD